jgi:hypothetical protein
LECKGGGDEGERERERGSVQTFQDGHTFFCGSCGIGCHVQVGVSVKIGFSGRIKLSVFYINNVTYSCWVHNFVDLTLNLALG